MTLLFYNGYLMLHAIRTLAFGFKTPYIMALCINCNIAVHAINQHYEYNALSMSPEIVSIIEEWTAQEVTDGDRICQECINLLLIELNNRNQHNIGDQQLGHQSIPANARACNACWQRAHNNIHEVMEPPREAQVTDDNLESRSSSVAEPVRALSSDIDNIVRNENRYVELDGYSRTPDSSNHCFVPECTNTERLRVPLYLKKQILMDYKLYISRNSRVCEEHASVYNWELLNEFQFTTQFTLNHVVEMLDLLRKKTITNIDFENVENMNNHVCRYWTGFTVFNFLTILSCISNQLSAVCGKPKLALGLYLMKIRTGEPIRRIASLICINKSVACIYMRKARNCLKEFYVPIHLGVNHISRASLTSRNLLIPQGLFGTAENNPIIICDRTYIYLQKSSNYLFQKKIYSLHKFSNLVKPFLLVATNGHIIDIFGLYAATTSDATIMQQLFQNENSTLRQYFRQSDIFILDHGFRDYPIAHIFGIYYV